MEHLTNAKPPANGVKAREKWQKKADKVRAKPGKWHRLLKNRASAAVIVTRIRRGRMVAFRPAEEYEAYSKVVNGKRELWVRYVGPGDPRVILRD
jgi:hypothetical protein